MRNKLRGSRTERRWFGGLSPQSPCENFQIFVGHGFSRAVTYLESMRLHCLRKKHQNFLSFRAERGISLSFHELKSREIPRSARNDKINYFFRSLFSRWLGPNRVFTQAPQGERCASDFFICRSEPCNSTGCCSSYSMRLAELVYRKLQSNRPANLELRGRLPSSGQ